ncbi:MAG: efflux transporter periplasmic adaptor subunit [Rhizobiales bacterium PAR1]|nr:MAG: efflux transporter periplasmic adaptor subunit [Rhizobiales bacterium PAR1]
MNRKRIVIWSVIALAAFGVLASWAWPRIFGETVAANRVERREVVQTVVATGRVETPSRVEIGTQSAGVVAAILVIEGQSVKAGETLIQLEEGEVRANVELARAGVRQAEGKLAQLVDFNAPNARQAVEQANANEVNAHNQFDRINQLTGRGYATPVQLDEARRALEVAASQVKIAKLQVNAASPGGSDVKLAEAALEQSRATLHMAEAKLGYMTIRAPADGLVITRTVEPGTVAQPGKALLIISPTRETRLVIQIDERNLGLIATGQPALASSDAYAKERFKAVLVFINPAVDPARGSVEVKLSVPEPPAYLREDMTVSVDIEVARRPNVLVLPTNAVRDSLSATPWVLAVAGNKTLRKPVKVGARGAAYIEILDGLAEGERVVPAIDIGTKAGQRVRVRMM